MIKLKSLINKKYLIKENIAQDIDDIHSFDETLNVMSARYNVCEISTDYVIRNMLHREEREWIKELQEEVFYKIHNCFIEEKSRSYIIVGDIHDVEVCIISTDSASDMNKTTPLAFKDYSLLFIQDGFTKHFKAIVADWKEHWLSYDIQDLGLIRIGYEGAHGERLLCTGYDYERGTFRFSNIMYYSTEDGYTQKLEDTFDNAVNVLYNTFDKIMSKYNKVGAEYLLVAGTYRSTGNSSLGVYESSDANKTIDEVFEEVRLV